MRQKRFLSWFLTLCLLLGMFCFPAYAEGNTTTTTISGDGTAEKTGTMTVTLVIPKKTPAAANLTYTAPSDLTYSGSDKAATVAAASGVTGLGTITVKYYSNASRSTEVTETKNVGTYYVGATVAEGDQYAASTAVLYGDGWTFTITASTPSAPAAPTKASATKNSITLNAVSGCEYSKDGSNWQSGTEFTGLLPGTEYTFYQRVKATANTNASPASSAKFSTEADTYAMTITLVIKPAQTIYTPTTPTTETVTIPVTGEEARTDVTVSVQGDTATITSADIDSVLSEEKSSGTVTIDVSSLRDNISEVVIPTEMVNKLADAVADKKNDADGVEVKLPAGTVTFDETAVAAIASQADGKDLHLNLDGIPQSKLNAKQQATIKDLTVGKVLDAYMTANGKRISDFQGGKAIVEVGFALKDGQKSRGVVVWYVADSGDKSEVRCSFDGRSVRFTVNHFSNYVIAYDEERAAEPVSDYEALTDEEKTSADAIAAALSTDANTAAQMLKYAQEKGIPLDTVLLGEQAILNLPTSDEDTAGSSFAKLTARATKRAKKSITLAWKQVEGADGYLIYGNRCGKVNKLLKDIKGNGTVKWTQKKLKKGKYYKYMVVAYKEFGEAKMPVAASVYVHTVTKGAKKTVAKSVKINTTSLTLGVGETSRLKATEVKAEKKKKLSKHRGIKYEVENPNVVSVAADGTVTALAEGSTTIYVYAQNGLFKTVTVTVTAAPAVPNRAEEAEAITAEDALDIDLAEPETDEALVELDDAVVEEEALEETEE